MIPNKEDDNIDDLETKEGILLAAQKNVRDLIDANCKAIKSLSHIQIVELGFREYKPYTDREIALAQAQNIASVTRVFKDFALIIMQIASAGLMQLQLDQLELSETLRKQNDPSLMIAPTSSLSFENEDSGLRIIRERNGISVVVMNSAGDSACFSTNDPDVVNTLASYFVSMSRK